MKTNVTLKLDADLLREARVLAAEQGRSISALLTERLESMVDEQRLPAGDELISEIERFLRERGNEPGHGQVH